MTDIREHTVFLELPDTKANLAAAVCHVSPARRVRRENVVWTEQRARLEPGVHLDHKGLPVKEVTMVFPDEPEHLVKRDFRAPPDAMDPRVTKENQLALALESFRQE